MSGDYWLGVATVPALAIVVALVWFGARVVRELRAPVENYRKHEKCGWGCRQTLAYTRWGESTLSWGIRRRRAFAKHMHTNAECRAAANVWRLERGDGKQWTAGFWPPL